MRSLIVLVIDKDGQSSEIADAIRRAGHRPVTSTGVDTALAVIGALAPDVIVIRSTTEQHDRRAKGALAAAAGEAEVPIRFLRAGRAVDHALDLDDAPKAVHQLN